MEFELKIKSPSDALSLGCPYAVAHLHLIDPETWKAYRKAQQAWSAYLLEINHWNRDRELYSQPERGRRPAGGPDARFDASQALVRCEVAALTSFRDRLLSGALFAFGRTDPLRFNSWQWIDPVAWKVLTCHRAPGTYGLDGQLRFVDVHFRDNEGVPDEQAYWAYASPELLAELTNCEQWGGASLDLPPWQQLPRDRAPVDWSYRAEAKLRWHRLIAQAAAELEEKIEAGRLERVNGLIRPVAPRPARRSSSAEPEAGPAFDNEAAERENESEDASRPIFKVSDQAIVEKLVARQKQSAETIKIPALIKLAQEISPKMTRDYFREHIRAAYYKAVKDSGVTATKQGRPPGRPMTRVKDS